MSKIDDNQIQERLKTISQIEPGPESTERAIQKARQALINKENTQQYTGRTIWQSVFKNPIIKFAAAAVLMICFGYIGGKFSARQPVDIEELRTVIRNDLTKEMDDRWQTVFTAKCTQLKDELQQQVRRDLTEFATQTLTASGTITNQRLMELAQLIEAARIKDREYIEKAFKQIELYQTRLGKGLVALASRTSEMPDIKEN
jgi:UDP-N-acetylenolpyruvoylglucosamine reductase